MWSAILPCVLLVMEPAELPVIEAMIPAYDITTGWATSSFNGRPYEIDATSSLPPTSGRSYDPRLISDGLAGTAWIEGVDGLGEGESVTFTAPCPEPGVPCVEDGDPYAFIPMPVVEIRLINGYAASPELWSANSRVALLEVSVNGIPRFVISLEDTMEPQVAQTLTLPQGPCSLGPGDSITFTILETYPGDRWEDTAIGELWVLRGQM